MNMNNKPEETEAGFLALARIGSADRSRQDFKRSLGKLLEALDSHYDFEAVRSASTDVIVKIGALGRFYDSLEKIATK